MKNIIRRTILYLLAPMSFGLFVFRYHMGTLSFADPGWWQWMMGNDDFVTMFLGWHFFRRDPWTWPPGKILSYGYPRGGAVMLTDSIPLAALLFKPFSSHLPADFQYMGGWMILTFMLQGVVGAMLTRLVTKNFLAILAGAFLFVLSPILITHYGLAWGTHWLILMALWLYLFDYKKALRLRTLIALSVALNIIAILVHPYVAAMVVCLSYALYYRLAFQEKIISWKAMLSLWAGILLADLGCIYLIGGFTISTGDFSNSSGLENPLHLDSLFKSAGMSRFPFMGHYWPYYCGEPYMYLGLGVLIIGVLGVGALLIKKWRPQKSSREYWAPLLVLCLGLTLFAISNKVSCNNRLLFQYPLPAFLIKASSPFRECARFFWPCYYLIMFLIIYSVCKGFDSRVAVVLLWFAVGLQLVEFKGASPMTLFAPCKSTLLTGLRYGWEVPNTTPLINPLWKKVHNYKGLMIFPNSFAVKKDSDFFYFDYLAANNGLFATCAYLARLDDGQEKYLKNSFAHVMQGHLDDSLIYVLIDVTRDLYRPYFLQEGVCRVVDGYTVCVKNSNNDFCRDLKSRKI